MAFFRAEIDHISLDLFLYWFERDWNFIFGHWTIIDWSDTEKIAYFPKRAEDWKPGYHDQENEYVEDGITIIERYTMFRATSRTPYEVNFELRDRSPKALPGGFIFVLQLHTDRVTVIAHEFMSGLFLERLKSWIQGWWRDTNPSMDKADMPQPLGETIAVSGRILELTTKYDLTSKQAINYLALMELRSHKLEGATWSELARFSEQQARTLQRWRDSLLRANRELLTKGREPLPGLEEEIWCDKRSKKKKTQ